MGDIIGKICKDASKEMLLQGTQPNRSLISLMTVIAANVILIFVALAKHITISEVIWVYWCEGVLIGGFQVLSLLSLEVNSIEYMKTKSHREPYDTAANLALFFALLQAPFHGLFALWIYYIDPQFDYRHTLLVMGGILLGQRVIVYFRESRAWGPERPLKEIIKESCIYFLRFIPLMGVYHYVEATETDKVNITVLTVEFMLFKSATDIIVYLIERRSIRFRKSNRT